MAHRGRGSLLTLLLMACMLTVLSHPLAPTASYSQHLLEKTSFRWPCFIQTQSIPLIRQAQRCGPLQRCGGATSWTSYAHKHRHLAGTTVMQTREAVCGLWTLRYNVEDEQHEATVWLEEAGNMRPMNVKNSSDRNIGFNSLRPSAGRWSLKRSTVMMYYRKPGELAHSWAGDLVEQHGSDVSANISRSIKGGVIQQGDSDPEFLGRFEAVQMLPTFTAEELLEMEMGRQRELVPRFAMESLVGDWTLQGGLYDEPVILQPLSLHSNGTFEARPDAAHRFGGRWGLYRDGPEEALQENREQSSKQKGSRRQGTHFWLWAQRGECQGFNMNADYRFIGRLLPVGVDDQVQLSVAQTAAQERLVQELGQAGARGRSRSEYEAPSTVRVSIKGMIFWGNIADMEYSDLAGSFTMQPVLNDQALD